MTSTQQSLERRRMARRIRQTVALRRLTRTLPPPATPEPEPTAEP
jgi:hypothetical protein